MRHIELKKINLVTIALINENGDLLLVKRACEPFSNLWSLPGGKIEALEMPIEAIKREVNEEIGVKLSSPILQGIETYTSPGLAQVHIFIQKVTNPLTLKLDEREVQDIAWVKFDNIDRYGPFPPNHRDVMQKYIPNMADVPGTYSENY